MSRFVPKVSENVLEDTMQLRIKVPTTEWTSNQLSTFERQPNNTKEIIDGFTVGGLILSTLALLANIR